MIPPLCEFTLAEIERQHILDTLVRCHSNRTQAARLLDISIRCLHIKLYDMFAASVGALFACLLVAGMGLIVHRPLTRVPENTLKFSVGVMLSAFGIFWTGEGLGVAWPGADLAIVAFIALFLTVGLCAVAFTRNNTDALL